METKTVFELLLESGRTISAEIDLEKVVQRVTDIGTELSGAQFGAFFYNVTNAAGESYVLYTISGVAREAFSKFPMPRNTKIFEPTFAARGTVRYDDVTAQPHYGQNPPYHGMPRGHLPVRSYLATPVVNPITGEGIGGLFFGHPEVGVFTEASEQLVEGLALQAAIAMSNARLFEERNRIEARLLEQKEQYASIFNATFDSMIIYDERGTIVEANPSACRIFGYSYDELIGQHAGLLFKNPEDFQILKELALSGRQYSGTNQRIRKDGSEFEAEFQGANFIFRGKPHVLSVVRDITSSRQAEAALEKSEELSNIITSVSPVVLWMTNAATSTIYLNRTWTDWVGGNPEDHLGVGWVHAVVEEDREWVQQSFLEAFRKRQVFSADFRIRRRSGEVRWCSTHGSPYFNRDGTFGGFAGSLTDITGRKNSEQLLQRSNLLIETITNNTMQALFLMDERQFCTYMNPAAETLTGYTLAEVQEKPLHYYIKHTRPDGRHYPIEESAIDRALPTQSQTQGEEVFIRKDGSYFPVYFIASPIIEEGVPRGTVIEARDTTEEKRVQEELRHQEKAALALLEEKVRERTAELEQRNYDLLQFTSIASHDLKEPVRKISVFSRMLQDKLKENLDSKSERYLNNIVESSTRMIRLIDDLLAFSRISNNEVPSESVDLNVLIDRIRDDLELAIHEKCAALHLSRLPTIEGNALQLGQVFQNLVSNSLKFVEPGRQPVITINAEPAQTSTGPGYRIIYSDNGIGFRPDQSEKIFEVFHRLHPREQYDGTGVGLAIVKKIIDGHHGTITAIGAPGNGARFEIMLPEKQKRDPK
ncbi:PAS domain S-box protein [Flaviaesturariibacter flavus]|uniref:histidine kinase n=1 Tax=Flaviaesturariibacter flavus TaxID=2502780 RepID=A0A4R1BBR2_9BACT|nr:PAS domain S-box protein [Flaviaesturariibacter flavus]TCJ14449.1 PAS domain S-box protein [Flaviaesturariibacter flavus]